MTTPRPGLEAPHRRKEQGPRILEKLAVAGYATATWVVAHVPGRLARWVIGTGSQAGYLVWPAKRQWSNARFDSSAFATSFLPASFSPDAMRIAPS